MSIITGCIRSTPIVTLHHLTGLPSIQNGQIEQRAHLVAKAMQDRKHGLHCLVRKALQTKSLTPRTPVTSLKNAPLPRPPRRRLNRKSWLDAAITDTMKVCGTHQLATKPCGIPTLRKALMFRSLWSLTGAAVSGQLVHQMQVGWSSAKK